MEKMERVLNSLDEEVNVMLTQWNLPGVSIALVKDGQVVMTKGYGKRDVAGNLDMTDETVLPVGSTTKSFTSLILSMLVDEGKLEWDKPVKEYIPWLKLPNEDLTERVTVRDLLSHRTGMPKYDVHGVFCTKDDRKAMVEDLQYLQTNAGLGDQLQYSNQMVMLAGYVAEVLTGKTWEELVKECIWEPLGMAHTNATIKELEACPEISKGYVFTGVENMETPYLSLKGIGPAGAINSSAKDMANYLLFQLGDGSWKGNSLVSAANLNEMHSVQMLGTPYFWKLDEISEANYGLGWFVDIYRGKRMLSHGGNTLGFSTLMTLLPEEDFGVVLISNGNSNFGIYALTYAILDKVLGVEGTDWNAKMQETVGGVFAQMAAGMQAKEEARVKDTTPSKSLDELAGVYSAPAFGTLSLQNMNGTLMGTLNEYQAIFNHYHYDMFDFILPLMGVNIPATFQYGEDGQVEGVSVIVEPTVAPVLFVKEK